VPWPIRPIDLAKSLVSRILQHFLKHELVSPLQKALSAGDYFVARTILEKGALEVPIESTFVSMVIGKKYIDEKYSDTQSTELLRLLIDRGMAVENWSSEIGSAVGQGKLESARLLLKHGAQVEKDKVLFDFGLSDRNPELLRLLVEHGANVHAKDRDGLNALEARLTLTPYPSDSFVAEMKALGMRVDQKKVDAKRRAYDELGRKLAAGSASLYACADKHARSAGYHVAGIDKHSQNYFDLRLATSPGSKVSVRDIAAADEARGGRLYDKLVSMRNSIKSCAGYYGRLDVSDFDGAAIAKDR
jgi:hypothetical protein